MLVVVDLDSDKLVESGIQLVRLQDRELCTAMAVRRRIDSCTRVSKIPSAYRSWMTQVIVDFSHL